MKSCHCANGVAPLKDLLSAYREQMSIPSFTGVLELVHAMPGRIRLRIPRLRRNVPEAELFRRQLSGLKGIEQVSANVFLGTVLIVLYVKKVLSGMSSKTIWRAFYSTNNYSMPESVFRPPCPVQYWYGEAERSARKRDIAYMKKVFPDTVFVENKGQDHAEFFTLHPDEFCKKLETFIRISR